MQESEALNSFYRVIINTVLLLMWLFLLLIDMQTFVQLSMSSILVMLPLYLIDKLFVQKL